MPDSIRSRRRALTDIPTREAAHELVSRGIPITLCRPGSKTPLGDGWNAERLGRGWPSKQWTRREIDRAYRLLGPLNVGIRMGPDSGLIDIEADSPAALRDYPELFDGDLPIAPTFQSSRGPHRFFRWDERLAVIAKAVIHYRNLEIRLGAGGRGAHSLVPPSVVKGVARVWSVPLEDCDPPSLPISVIQRILESAAHPSEVILPDTQIIACVSESLRKHDLSLIDAAIADTLPTGHGHRYRQLFILARRLKSIPTTAAASRAALREIVEKWHRSALPTIATKPFEETWADFSNAWKNVKYPADRGPLCEAYRAALAAQLPAAARNYELPHVRNLIALCRQLQAISGDQPFYLACRSAGELLGISFVSANRWLQFLEQEEVIVCCKRGTRSRASEFRYIAESLPPGAQL